MLCLGIETSCDETAVALVDRGKVLDHLLASQVDLHSIFGGVVPELASREHLRNLGPLLDQLLEKTGTSLSQIEGIAVVRGPGLLGSLLVGVGLSKGLALSLGLPLVGVNHLHAHLLAPGLERDLAFPSLGLLVSGGHTHIYRIDSPVEFELLGKTIDDAAGEAFDKVAKLLNFPYPGGKIIDQLGQKGIADTSLFPRPYLDNQNLDFSFSGLKTAVANYVHRYPDLAFEKMDTSGKIIEKGGKDEHLTTVCASFNWSVAETLRIKTERALRACDDVRSLIVAGGVAANSHIRSAMAVLARERGIELVLPGLSLCTDNAAMVAYTGEILLTRGLQHGLDLEAVPRGRPIPDDYSS